MFTMEKKELFCFYATKEEQLRDEKSKLLIGYNAIESGYRSLSAKSIEKARKSGEFNLKEGEPYPFTLFTKED